MRGSPKRLVVGLGNPGARYHATRHNVGFAVLDRLAQREGVLFESSLALAREGYVGPANAEVAWLPGGPSDSGGRALLVKPQTYMNLSGEAVGPLLDWAQLEPADLLVVYDDLDLPHAKLRIRPHGSSGGQRGMASIIETLNTDRFPRLRVGIGRSETAAARQYVLETFAPDEEAAMDASTSEACDAILAWLDGTSLSDCMSRFHSRWNEGPHDGPAHTQGES